MKYRHTKNKLSSTPIHSVISRLINELSATIGKSNETDTGRSLQSADDALLATTLTALVDTVITEHKNNFVRISAHRHRDLVMLHIRHTGPFNFSAISESLHKTQLFAEKMNGYIGVTTYLNNSTTIAFSFNNILREE